MRSNEVWESWKVWESWLHSFSIFLDVLLLAICQPWPRLSKIHSYYETWYISYYKLLFWSQTKYEINDTVGRDSLDLEFASRLRCFDLYIKTILAWSKTESISRWTNDTWTRHCSVQFFGTWTITDHHLIALIIYIKNILKLKITQRWKYLQKMVLKTHLLIATLIILVLCK